MPSQLLHTLFGEDVILELHRRVSPRFGATADNALEKIQNIYRKVFALGCQGPDIFYHSQLRRPVGLEYGTLLHRQGVGVFTAGLLKMGLPDTAPVSGMNALGVYALGFMTHSILDRLTHPYIVFKSDRPPPVTTRRDRSHAFLERIIDTLMFSLLRGKDILCWDQNGILAETCKNPPPGLRELLVRALIQAFPERAGKDAKLAYRIENTFLDCADFYHITDPVFIMTENRQGQSLSVPGSSVPAVSRSRDLHSVPPQTGHIAYLYPIDLPSDIDFLNLNHHPWYYPAGAEKKDIRSFPEIYAEAVKAAADSLAGIITKYLEKGLFPIEDAVRSIGNGGLSIVDEAGKPCAPCRADPLPLQETLEDQMRKRGFCENSSP